jgi:hypothetical protein
MQCPNGPDRELVARMSLVLVAFPRRIVPSHPTLLIFTSTVATRVPGRQLVTLDGAPARQFGRCSASYSIEEEIMTPCVNVYANSTM